MYKVANASEYLVITGVGIPDMIKLAKKAHGFFPANLAPSSTSRQ
ncbi:hypothetical protein CCACVL1_30032 [Corchorus capsularis]|uniref:Uncharacterized protein n=1 Tax=Corchorus capsularis TaxID=210143 RepID=A0A1R3FZ09_COCAP|nr:hypothetical protein CCACVL1_30032 [Corchorus capsularis]